MFGPTRATVLSPYTGHIAGVCRTDPPGALHGWFVRYSRRQAVVQLQVALTTRSGNTMVLNRPFVIDTGAPVTFIPGQMLGDHAVPANLPTGRGHVLTGVGDTAMLGYPVAASLTMTPPGPELDALLFDRVTLLAVDDWEGVYGVLGLDALRHLIMIADSQHMCLWPRVRS